MIQINRSGKTGLLMVLPLILFFSCKKEEFEGQRPDERIAAALDAYYGTLAGSEYGWKGNLFPAGGRGFGFFFRFDRQNRVSMLADISDQTRRTAKESSYRIRATLTPSLYFDTYTYLHQLADPDPAVNNGTPGFGLYSDFEFSIQYASKDTLLLKGNLFGSRLELIRATREEAAAYEAGNLAAMKRRVSQFLEDRKFTYIEDAAGNIYTTAIDTEENTLIVNYDSAGTIATQKFGLSFFGTDQLIMSMPFRHDKFQFDRLIIDSQTGELQAAQGGQHFVLWDTEVPPFAFSAMWGVGYESIVVPIETEAQGNGAEFNLRRTTFLQNARTLLAAGTTFPEMTVTIDRKQQLLFVNQLIRQGANNFNARFVFSFIQQGDEYTFKYEGATDDNAKFLENAFIPVLEGFLYGKMQFDYDLELSELRASGQSGGLPGFKFVGRL
ncbi:DUF4302 domain-containing protein [Chitinophaga barathri]|uniref:DUF4302 domain-containing protein n=1 Tax=Chitinophaga barathri TaxID=1647451 RepID=A0A3N4N1E7_9BACT|nr:DUF4302 domain-containing protein [Chitinophaga barathri]RPD41433.1 DUF4302 domain-containing protein [Chitinophaga barathri]